MGTQTQPAWPRVAVMGAGAVGCYFGGMLARAGAPVTLIGRSPLVDAVTRNGLFIDSIHFQESVRIAASSDPAVLRDAEIVLFCVKTTSDEEAAAAIRPRLGAGAIVVSLQNGVDNVERLHAAGVEALPCVVYVAASVPEPGRVKHVGRGELLVGHATRRADVARVAETFTRAGVPCRLTDNIEGALWNKMLMNCAYNAISAIAQAKYGRIAANPNTREVMRHVIAEAVAVARAAGVTLPDANFVEQAWKLGETMPEALSSTAQDVARGKRTEIDSLNGYIARRGAQLGVPTPANLTLHALVKLLEEKM